MIDEKGRLFGKINIVDLLVIVVIVIAAVFVGLKFIGRDSAPTGITGEGKLHVTYTVLVQQVEPEVYENIKACLPSTLMASGELLDGQVVDVTAAPHEGKIAFSPTGDAAIVPVDSGLYDLTFTIECNVVNAITTEIGTQEVRIGKTHIVKTDLFELNNGVVLSVEREAQ